MDDPALVGVLHGPGQCFNQHGGALGREGRSRQGTLERASRNVLERQERPAFVLADLMDLHDALVLKPGDKLGLGPKPGSLVERRRGRRRGSS